MAEQFEVSLSQEQLATLQQLKDLLYFAKDNAKELSIFLNNISSITRENNILQEIHNIKLMLSKQEASQAVQELEKQKKLFKELEISVTKKLADNKRDILVSKLKEVQEKKLASILKGQAQMSLEKYQQETNSIQAVYNAKTQLSEEEKKRYKEWLDTREKGEKDLIKKVESERLRLGQSKPVQMASDLFGKTLGNMPATLTAIAGVAIKQALELHQSVYQSMIAMRQAGQYNTGMFSGNLGDSMRNLMGTDIFSLKDVYQFRKIVSESPKLLATETETSYKDLIFYAGNFGIEATASLKSLVKASKDLGSTESDLIKVFQYASGVQKELGWTTSETADTILQMAEGYREGGLSADKAIDKSAELLKTLGTLDNVVSPEKIKEYANEIARLSENMTPSRAMGLATFLKDVGGIADIEERKRVMEDPYTAMMSYIQQVVSMGGEGERDILIEQAMESIGFPIKATGQGLAVMNTLLQNEHATSQEIKDAIIEASLKPTDKVMGDGVDILRQSLGPEGYLKKMQERSLELMTLLIATTAASSIPIAGAVAGAVALTYAGATRLKSDYDMNNAEKRYNQSRASDGNI